MGGFGPDSRVPDELWCELSPKARYMLDGESVFGTVFGFIDGLILRTLDIFDAPQHLSEVVYPHGVVIGETSSDRVPSLVIGKEMSDLRTWLRMCRSGTFWLSPAVPMYYYIFPVEAAITFGDHGKYGTICIEPVRYPAANPALWQPESFRQPLGLLRRAGGRSMTDKKFRNKIVREVVDLENFRTFAPTLGSYV